MMQSVSQLTSSLGQQNKARSFTEPLGDWKNAVLIGLPPPSGVTQVSPATTVPQDENKGEGFQLGKRIALPQTFHYSPVPILRTRQLWEGTVLSCDELGFTARLIDRTNPKNPDEIAVFEVDEVSADDRQLVGPGAFFYVMVGTEKSRAGGQIQNVMRANFRRLPRWSRSSIEAVGEKVNEVLSLFEDSEI